MQSGGRVLRERSGFRAPNVPQRGLPARLQPHPMPCPIAHPAHAMAAPFSSSSESGEEGFRHPRHAKNITGPDAGAGERDNAMAARGQAMTVQGQAMTARGQAMTIRGQAMTARGQAMTALPDRSPPRAIPPEVSGLAPSGIEGQTGTVPRQMESQPWPDLLREAMVVAGVSKEQMRPLIMVTAFTGLGSQSRMWRATGLRFRELASADPKRHANLFLATHDLFGEHHFDGIRMLTKGGSAACARCHRVCGVPMANPDLFAGGFPCQPTSRARRSKKKLRAEEHNLFPTVQATVEYIRARRPRVALLEQTLGALDSDEFAGRRMSECEWVENQLRDIYGVAHAVLSLQPWVCAHRSRVWLFLVSHDTGANTDAQQLATQASTLATALQEHRARSPPVPFRNFLSAPADPDWPSVLVDLLPKPRQAREAPTDLPEWRQLCDGLRAQWHHQGHAWANTHPLANAQMRGCTGTERVREVLECTLLEAGRRAGFDMGRPEGIAAAKVNNWCDFSQNALLGGSKPRSFCTTTRLYDYEQDRVILPVELLKAMGWTAGGGVTFRNMSENQARDLVGECQALQPLAVASWALILAAGDALPGLWRSEARR